MKHPVAAIKLMASICPLIVGIVVFAPRLEAQQGGVNCTGCAAKDGSDVAWVSGGDCDGISFSLLVDIRNGECLRRSPMECEKESCSSNYQVEWSGVTEGWQVLVGKRLDDGTSSGTTATTVDADGHGFFEPSSSSALACGDDLTIWARIRCSEPMDPDEPLPLGVPAPDSVSLEATGECTPCPSEGASAAAAPPRFNPEVFDLGTGRIQDLMFSAPGDSQDTRDRSSTSGREIPLWQDVEIEVLTLLIRTPEQHDRFKELHTRWMEVSNAEWVSERFGVPVSSVGPSKLTRLREIAEAYAPSIETAAERYAQDFQQRLIEKFETREFWASPRTAGPLHRPVESSFSSMTLACKGWGVAFSMTPHGDPLLWAQRQELRALTEARELEASLALGLTGPTPR